MSICTIDSHNRAQAQRLTRGNNFLAAYDLIASHRRPRRHHLSAVSYRQTRDERFATWRVITCTPAMA